MTGIQALEHKYPDKPVIPEKAARMEFEYIRHGTTSLIGFFDVATGCIEKPESLVRFVAEICRIYAACGVSQTPILLKMCEEEIYD